MRTMTKVFKSGNSQAVRIPGAFKLDVEEVSIEKLGDGLLIRPPRAPWADYFAEMQPLEDFPDSIEPLADTRPNIDFDE